MYIYLSCSFICGLPILKKHKQESNKAYFCIHGETVLDDEEQRMHIVSNVERSQGSRKQCMSFCQTVTVKPYYENINEECQQAMQVLCKKSMLHKYMF